MVFCPNQYSQMISVRYLSWFRILSASIFQSFPSKDYAKMFRFQIFFFLFVGSLDLFVKEVRIKSTYHFNQLSKLKKTYSRTRSNCCFFYLKKKKNLNSFFWKKLIFITHKISETGFYFSQSLRSKIQFLNRDRIT